MAEKQIKFEASMDRLEQILALLERGDTTLEESMTLFEEGTQLLKYCNGLLDQAEQKIVKLTPGPNDTVSETDFLSDEE